MNLKWQNRIVNDEVPPDGTPSGGAPAAPSVETPLPVVPAASEAPDASSNVDWDEVVSDDLGTGGEETPPPVAPTPPVQEAPKVEPPPAAPKVETPPVAAPVQAEVTPPPTPAQPQPSVPPKVTHEEIRRQIQEGREKFTRQLEAQTYAIPAEVTPNLVAEPEKVLPGLFAKAHVAIMDQVADYVQSMLPQLMRQTQQQDVQTAEALKQFYGAWPELQDPKYTPVVARQLIAYRQANPTAKPEDVIHEGGISALVALRLPIPERIMKVHNAETPPAVPQTPFTPASAAGSAPSAPPAGPQTNVFAILAQEDVAENA